MPVRDAAGQHPHHHAQVHGGPAQEARPRRPVCAALRPPAPREATQLRAEVRGDGGAVLHHGQQVQRGRTHLGGLGRLQDGPVPVRHVRPQTAEGRRSDSGE